MSATRIVELRTRPAIQLGIVVRLREDSRFGDGTQGVVAGEQGHIGAFHGRVQRKVGAAKEGSRQEAAEVRGESWITNPLDESLAQDDVR